MEQEKYNLSWRTYSDHLREMLHDMLKSEKLTDVTLVCDDKRQFKAHKIVLSACSSVFKSIISDLSQKSSVIYLRGIKHQEMESILEFMYLGVPHCCKFDRLYLIHNMRILNSGYLHSDWSKVTHHTHPIDMIDQSECK